jgi:hypothetical protein
MTKLIGMITALALALLLGQAALAEQGGGSGKRQGRGGQSQDGPRRPPVVFGVLQSVSGDSWTIKPQVPPHRQERMEKNGKQPPQLPDQITVTVNAATKYWLNGAASSAGAFKAGDQLVVKLQKQDDGRKLAMAIADPETAREFILEKMKEGREGGKGKGGGKGGKAKGRGGQGQAGKPRGPRPMFGTITAVSSSSLTIRPEVPAFLSAKLPQKGDKLAGELPESITVALGSETKFIVNKQEQSSNPFSSGDRVAIVPQGEPGSATARIVSDYTSAQARLEQRIEKRQQRQQSKPR